MCTAFPIRKLNIILIANLDVMSIRVSGLCSVLNHDKVSIFYVALELFVLLSESSYEITCNGK
jgi:hypothetical protein